MEFRTQNYLDMYQTDFLISYCIYKFKKSKSFEFCRQTSLPRV